MIQSPIVRQRSVIDGFTGWIRSKEFQGLLATLADWVDERARNNPRLRVGPAIYPDYTIRDPGPALSISLDYRSDKERPDPIASAMMRWPQLSGDKGTEQATVMASIYVHATVMFCRGGDVSVLRPTLDKALMILKRTAKNCSDVRWDKDYHFCFIRESGITWDTWDGLERASKKQIQELPDWADQITKRDSKA